MSFFSYCSHGRQTIVPSRLASSSCLVGRNGWNGSLAVSLVAEIIVDIVDVCEGWALGIIFLIDSSYLELVALEAW
jgi:hypothetical protein